MHNCPYHPSLPPQRFPDGMPGGLAAQLRGWRWYAEPAGPTFRPEFLRQTVAAQLAGQSAPKAAKLRLILVEEAA